MEYVTLGRTGLRVSVMGLGCGGHSRLGQETGKSEKESIAVVRRAIETGINFIDTAEAYDTESIVGKAIKNVKRESVILSTKKTVRREESSSGAKKQEDFIKADEMIKGIEGSLSRLGTDYIDVFHLHGVRTKEYEYAVKEVLPALFKMRDQGKIRFIGITEAFGPEPQHRMLERALHDDFWDVMMVGFNMLNQSARQRVFTKTIEKNIGVLVMFAVRRALSRPERLKELMAELKVAGLVDPALFDENDPLGFLIHDGGALSLQDGAYRYCRHEPGVHVVLSGTGNVEHLEANAKSLLRPPLPSHDLARLRELFSKVDNISGN
jgi:aryl-alcohol dehydrogenase-like predicted oxidoreductase